MKLKTKFKRSLIIFLVIAMVFSMVGCQKPANANDTKLFKPGTYTGVGEGIHGKIEVEVTVTENEIKEIKVLKHSETEGVSTIALEKMPAKILESQSLGVDIMSGATKTSNGVLEAVTDALTKAGADIEALKNKAVVQAKQETIEKTVDVVVIGGGGAGLSSAISAHQNGASVLVLEKMSRVGGNTMISGAAYNTVDPVRQKAQGIEDSVEKHFTQTYEGGDKLGNPELIRTLVENSYPTLQWLEGLGMEFKDELFTVLGGLWPRAHAPAKPLGTGFIETYMNYIDKNKDKMEVMVNTKAYEIIMENGKAVGVKATGENGEVIVHANKGVILAAGGFGNNPEMREEYNKHWPTLVNIKSTNHSGATGDGITMAKAINANLVGMEWIQLLPMGDPESGSLSGNIEQSVENRIFVNKDGNRFVDEGARRDVMTKALMEQKDSFMWVVLDSQNYPTGDEKNHFNESINELVAAGRAYKADTLEDLAKQIGVDPANLVKAVENFNANVDSKTADEFGRTLYQWKIDKAPYYAGARVPTVHHTMGGVQIDTETHAIDTAGNIIPGLYAAGEVTGGIHGSNRLGGNALADINVFGRIAGANAALGK
jgi:flavocytochrome c